MPPGLDAVQAQYARARLSCRAYPLGCYAAMGCPGPSAKEAVHMRFAIHISHHLNWTRAWWP